MKKLVVVRGGGDIATGAIWHLHRCGCRILILECEKPSAIRRKVAFCEAVYDRTSEVEGVLCRKVDSLAECEAVWNRDEIPLLVDEAGISIGLLRPEVVIDAILAKNNLGTTKEMAPLTIALGPGFTAGEDVHVVVETMRGHDLGRSIRKGSAMPNTGVPGIIAGFGKERVIHAPAAGVIRNQCQISDVVEKGQILAFIGDVPVVASLNGVLRGIIRDGYFVYQGMKIADIDPRISEQKNCFTISDKSRCVGGGVAAVVLEHFYHMKKVEESIYLDNAATTLHKPEQVLEAVAQAMQGMGNSSRGTHAQALTAARAIYDTREQLAEMFHCRPDHVIFTSNSTEALNIAIHGLFGAGDHVISTDLEHNSVLRPLYRLRDEGAEVSFIPADAEGQVDVTAFEKMIRPNTRGIVCTHGSNLTGDLLDLKMIGRLAREKNLLFVVDASQTAGVFPLSMEEMGIDVLCFTGHKSLMGPQGTGGLCIREGLTLKSWKVGGSGIHTYEETQPKAYPTALEAGTLNGHGIAGLGAGLRYIQETGMERIREKVMALADYFYQKVCQIPGVKVYGDFSKKWRAPIVTLNIRDLDSSEVSDLLSQEYGIATRPGAHCAPRLHRALGTVEQGAVRFSFSWFNTMEEAELAAEAVRKVAEEL